MEPVKRTVLVLSSVVFLVMLGISIILPVLPLYGRALGASEFFVGLLVGALPAARVFLDLPAGTLGDRYGNPRMMRAGLGIIALSSFGAAIAFDYAVLLAVRVLEGVGSALYVTSSLATLARTVPMEKRGRYMGIYVNLLLVGQVVGPVVGGAVSIQWGLRAPFVAYGLAATAGLVLLALTLPGTSGRAEARIDWAAARRLVRDRSFVTVNIGSLAAFFMRGGIIATVLPFFLALNWGLSEGDTAATAGLLVTIMALASMATMYPSGALADRYGRKPTFVTSLVLMGLVIPFVYTTIDLTSAIPVMVVFGLVLGLHGPLASWVTDLSPTNAMGTAMGLYRTIGDTGYLFGSVFLGGVLEVTKTSGQVSHLPFTIAAVWMVVSGLLLLTARDPSGERARARARAASLDAPEAK
ncbi:MAG TPA: MFS transporter [Thermoplasmata archaeon]|jgi:MFS family permease